MSHHRFEAPLFRSDCYRNGFYRFVRWILVEVVIILGLLGCIAYTVLSQPPTHYFVTTTGGVIFPLDSGKVAM